MKLAVACQLARSSVVCGVAAFAVLASPLVAAAHPTIPQVFAALGRVHAIDATAIAPHGRTIAWSEAAQAKRGTTTVSSEAIYVAPIGDATAATRITGCPGTLCDDGDFAWSPDGTKLAFLTTDGKGQAELAVATLPSGSTVRLTHGSHGPMTSPKWSPDGKRIAVLYTKGAPKAPGPLNPLGRDAGVLGATYFEQRIAIAPLAGGALRLVSPADLYVYEYDWSPDGTRFAASAAHGSGDDNWWVAELYTIASTSGATRKIHHPERQMASPRWSGDGKRIAYIGGLMSDEGITGGDVFTIPAAGGAATNITPDRKASITTIAWNGAAHTLLVTYLQGGAMGIASVNADTKTFAPRWRANETIFANSLGGFTSGNVGISLARDGVTSAVIRQSFTRAPEIAVGPIGAWKPFTARNATTPHVLARVRSISWKSDAYTPQGWLAYPDGYTPGKRYPMVVIAHGGPSFANESVFPNGPSAWDAMLASQGYFVFEPNPRGSYGQGEAFTAANIRDFGGGDLRDILTGIDAAERTVSIDDKRVGIFGWSYGGYMTMWALTQTHRFRAGVSGAGLANWQSYYGTNNISTWMIPFFGKSVYDDPAVYEKSSPIAFIKNVTTPTLLIAGDRDAEVPITQSYEYWNALKALHVPTRFVVYPDEGHLFGKVSDQIDVANRLVRWFDRWLK